MTSKLAKITMIINGISVTADECSHCHGLPSDQEARDAVQRFFLAKVQDPQYPCAHCGEPVKITAFYLYHDDLGSWTVSETELESHFRFSFETTNGRSVHDRNRVHSRCMGKALPHVRGLA